GSDAGTGVDAAAPAGTRDAGHPSSGSDAATGGDAAVPPAPDSGPPSPPPPVHCDAAPMVTRGAALPYQEYEAEDGKTNGMVIGPNRAVNDADVMNSIAGESSGRKAVKLTATGQSVTVTSACAASALVVRYVIPDSGDGSGGQASLGVYVGGARVASLSLTSRYAWAYGNPATTNATTNTPSDGYARHFYDEARVVLPSAVPAGATVTLQRDSQDGADYYVIDLVDLEALGGPASQPGNALAITDCGATPDDGGDDGAAIQKCISLAEQQGKAVWIPPGVFEDAATDLKMQGVTVTGAGMWYSTIHGAGATFDCVGTHCTVANLSLLGETVLRDDANSVHAIAGAFGTGSLIQNVWVEHYTTGPWIGVANAPGADGLQITGCRFRDLFADGVNLCNGTVNAKVEQSQARNTGDDAFASWAIGTSAPNTGNVFQFDTVQVPWKANCYAIYGGSNNAIEDSVCADVVTYPGIFIDQDFQSNPFGGTTTVARNTILRGGGPMYGTSWGALTVSGREKASPIVGVQVSDLDIQDATFSGVLFVGPSDAIQGLTLDGVTIENPGDYGLAVDQQATGSVTASNVVVTSPAAGAGLDNEAPLGAFTITRGNGNSGW
ncbi:MAG TPA: glycosyl hydrolase family 28-related protein, partial [Polyangiaceae bacterium]